MVPTLFRAMGDSNGRNPPRADQAVESGRPTYSQWSRTPLNLTLSWPPSLNNYLRHIVVKGKPRTLLSKEARDYQTRVGQELLLQGLKSHPTKLGRLQVTINGYPPDKRRRDVDGFAKVVLDCLTLYKIYKDDEQIDSLTIRRCHQHPQGKLEVFITEL